jgi:hypothetical protein
VLLFWMVEILFGLFVENSNGELRRTTIILSLPQNSRITTILTVSEQQIYVWIHNYYSYSENSSYSTIPGPSKHTPEKQQICKSEQLHYIQGQIQNFDHDKSFIRL